MKELFDFDFENLLKESYDNLIFVKFYNDVCPGCNEMSNTLYLISDMYRENFDFYQYNTKKEHNENRIIINEYGIKSLPSFVILRNEQPIAIIRGKKSLQEMIDILDKI